MQRPRFRYHQRIQHFPPSDLVVVGEIGHSFVTGEPLATLAPLLDGRHTMSELAQLTADALSPPELWYAVMQGEARGYLCDAALDTPETPDRLAFWDTLGVAPATAAERLTTARVNLSAVGAAAPDGLRAALQLAGVALGGDDGDLNVVVTDDYLRPELRQINDGMLLRGRSWMLVRPLGAVIWIGPIFRPHQTACWECLADRLNRNRELERFIEAKTGKPAYELVPPHRTAGGEDFACSLAALEIVRFITAATPAEAELLTFDFAHARLRSHALVRRPQCPACGKPGPVPEHPPRLVSAPLAAPAETQRNSLAKLRRLVDPVTGIVASLRKTEDPVRGLVHNFVATHEFPMVRENIAVLEENAYGRSGGAGLGEESAELAALGEAVERISGIWRGEEESVTRASCAELGGAAIDLAACLLYSEAQYAAAGEWNARQRAARELVPRRLDSAEPIDWTPVWSLASRERRYLPSAYCYYGHPEAALAFCFADSNGCAAGPTLEAAVRSGLMELIERDAVAIWWYNRLSRPEIDTASFDLPFADQLRSYYRTVGRDLVVLDLTHDIGVPVFAGISARLDGGAEEIMLGFGADLDPKVALARALRELAQFHPIVAQRNARGETIYTTGNEDAIDWLRTGRRAQNPHLAPSQAPKRTAAQFVTRPGADPLADVGACVHALAKVGIEPFVCVQTRPDIDIPVARVVAPGLRHFWRRLAPGRLFGVPAAMGWADRPLHEHELNPVAIFF